MQAPDCNFTIFLLIALKTEKNFRSVTITEPYFGPTLVNS